MTIIAYPDSLAPGGILEVEARHQWNGGVVLGDQEENNPRVRIFTIGGLQSLPDLEDNREPLIGRRGEIPRRSVRRGKTLTYDGVVRSPTLHQLRSTVSQLSAAFYDTDEGVMLVTPNPAYAFGFSRFYRARAISFDPGDVDAANERVRFRYEQPFTLGLRMSDPRFYDPQDVIATTTELVEAEGLAPPFTPPFTIPAGGSLGSVLVNNEGNAPTDPTIDIFGPISNPVLTNSTTGLVLGFTGLTIAEDSFVRVNFRTRTILSEGLTDARSRIDWTQSSWWDGDADGLPPGESQITLRGTAIADPARAQITFYPAYYA